MAAPFDAAMLAKAAAWVKIEAERVWGKDYVPVLDTDEEAPVLSAEHKAKNAPKEVNKKGSGGAGGPPAALGVGFKTDDLVRWCDLWVIGGPGKDGYVRNGVGWRAFQATFGKIFKADQIGAVGFLTTSS